MTEKTESKQVVIKPGSPEMEQMLSTGYGIDKRGAEAIVKAYETNPLSVPYERYERAEAFLLALKTKPKAIDTEPGWKRSKVR